MRIASVIVAGGALMMAGPALAEIPGPFVCTIGDAGLQLYPDDTATEYSGEWSMGADSGGDMRRPAGAADRVTLSQSHTGWRYVYAGSDLTLVIAGDSATLYGDFGAGECFASRSVPVGAGWEYGAAGENGSNDQPADNASLDAGVQVVTRGADTWTEVPIGGTALTWGGNVRSGPGTEFGRVTGVPLGVTVALLARTDRRWLESDPWYKVRLPNGRTGYIPGGLLCTLDGRDGFFNQRNCEG